MIRGMSGFSRITGGTTAQRCRVEIAAGGLLPSWNVLNGGAYWIHPIVRRLDARLDASVIS